MFYFSEVTGISHQFLHLDADDWTQRFKASLY